MMPNRLDSLPDGPADVLVVGGGIHGLFVAYDAAARGLSVVLVERGDFGSGLTFNHQRTLHGGLRELQRGHLRKAREQIRERRTWARIAPHLLRPLPFLVGTYGWTTKSRWAVRAGLKVYDLIGRRRNTDVSTELHLPKSRLESAAATRRLSQGVSGARLSGGAIWYDYQTTHPDRLTWAVALGARQAGARLFNYVEATGPIVDEGRVAGARIRDGLTGAERDIAARVTVLAVGSASGTVGSTFGLAMGPPLVRAMNLLLNRPARDIATAAPGRNGRMLTAVPWRGFVLAGTHQSDAPVESLELQPPESAVDACLADVNHAFSQLKATRADIRLIHFGLTPARMTGGRVELLPEPVIVAPSRGGRAGVVGLIGVKYTGARLAAERAVDAVVDGLAGGRRRCRTSTTGLPYAGIADVEGRLVETLRDTGLQLERDQIEHLGSWYGTEASDVIRYTAAHGLLQRLDQNTPVVAGEIAYAVEHAQALRLADAVLRRTPLGSAGHPGAAALEAAAAVMAQRLGWTPDQRQRELDDVVRIYSPRSAATSSTEPVTAR